MERQRELEQANFYLEELNAELELQKEEAQHLAAELGEANRRLERAKAAAEREARRITGLQAMTAALAAALTECNVAASAVDHGVVALDARAAAFLRLTADAQALECGPAFGWSPEALECLERLPLTEPSLPTLAIEQSDPVFLEDPMPGGPLSPSVERLHRCLSAAGIVVAVPIQAKGRPLGVLALAFDRRRNLSGEDRRVLAVIGSLVGQALERARLYEAGMEAKRVAEEASQARSQFLAVMSHELRTPLNAILGYQDLLTAEVVGPLNETQKRHAERIGSSARHLLQLIDDILESLAPRGGQGGGAAGAGRCLRLAREVAEMIQPMAERKGLAFRVSTSGDSFPLESDPGRLRQILLNLLGNAVKFTDRGEIELSVARDSDDMVVFTVRDTGVGIAPADQERIFEPFIQATAAAPGVAGGTGLGLAVSRNLARLLGGDLIVERARTGQHLRAAHSGPGGSAAPAGVSRGRTPGGRVRHYPPPGGHGGVGSRTPYHSPVVNCSPTIPVTIRPIQISRTGVACSPKSRMPSVTVPIVPIPVQTAYAVPSGSVRTARPSRPMLRMTEAAVSSVGPSRVKPSVYLSPTAQPISNSPAMKGIAQAMAQSRRRRLLARSDSSTA